MCCEGWTILFVIACVGSILIPPGHSTSCEVLRSVAITENYTAVVPTSRTTCGCSESSNAGDSCQTSSCKSGIQVVCRYLFVAEGFYCYNIVCSTSEYYDSSETMFLVCTCNSNTTAPATGTTSIASRPTGPPIPTSCYFIIYNRYLGDTSCISVTIDDFSHPSMSCQLASTNTCVPLNDCESLCHYCDEFYWSMGQYWSCATYVVCLLPVEISIRKAFTGLTVATCNTIALIEPSTTIGQEISTSVIVGAVVGSVGGLILITSVVVIVVVLYRRRHKSPSNSHSVGNATLTKNRNINVYETPNSTVPFAAYDNLNMSSNEWGINNNERRQENEQTANPPPYNPSMNRSNGLGYSYPVPFFGATAYNTTDTPI